MAHATAATHAGPKGSTTTKATRARMAAATPPPPPALPPPVESAAAVFATLLAGPRRRSRPRGRIHHQGPTRSSRRHPTGRPRPPPIPPLPPPRPRLHPPHSPGSTIPPAAVATPRRDTVVAAAPAAAGAPAPPVVYIERDKRLIRKVIGLMASPIQSIPDPATHRTSANRKSATSKSTPKHCHPIMLARMAKKGMMRAQSNPP